MPRIRRESSKLFISWGGSDARQIGEWLRLRILSCIPGFQEAFISSEMTPMGSEWRNVVHAELVRATHCVGIMTDVALSRPWFMYELAFLKGRIDQIPLLRFCPRTYDGPLSAIQDLDGFDFQSVIELSRQLMAGYDEVTRKNALQVIESKAALWKELVEPIRQNQQKSAGLRGGIVKLSQTLSDERLFNGLATHACMRELACKALDDVTATFNNAAASGQSLFAIDYRRYPEYLTHLQRSLNCKTQAVALVEDVEEFWAQKTGKQIMDTTSRDSQRVFVFANQTLFDQYFGNVLNHAEKYLVFVMSSSEFSRAVRYRPRGDFSILTEPRTGQQVTAFYDKTTHNIQFSTQEDVITSNVAMFEDILTRAHRIAVPKDEAETSVYRDKLKSELFSSHSDDGLHHSDWIPIHRYDAFEEDHPYYREMHECMLAEFRKRVPEQRRAFRVLEIGAGTGHFTKKLAQQPYPGMTIKAMEPDPRAQALLDLKLQHRSAMVQSIAASALSYDPRGEFRFVFSSFSEHHIRPEDKQRYFRLVAEAMEDDGCLIIGDEFLMPHDITDPAQHLQALEKYHTFIIDEAKARGLHEVATLEELAWESGKPDARVRIDYKIPVQLYKDFAKSSGLILDAEFCITPENLAATIGGIYVLVFRKRRMTAA